MQKIFKLSVIAILAILLNACEDDKTPAPTAQNQQQSDSPNNTNQNPAVQEEQKPQGLVIKQFGKVINNLDDLIVVSGHNYLCTRFEIIFPEEKTEAELKILKNYTLISIEGTKEPWRHQEKALVDAENDTYIALNTPTKLWQDPNSEIKVINNKTVVVKFSLKHSVDYLTSISLINFNYELPYSSYSKKYHYVFKQDLRNAWDKVNNYSIPASDFCTYAKMFN